MAMIQTGSRQTATEKDVIELFERFVVPSYGRTPVVFTEGRGARLKDINGRVYLDFGGGIAVNCLGHAHPAVTQAIVAQAQSLTHVSNLYFNEPQGRLAETLVRLMGGTGKMFFCNSGAEANECLFKLARLAANNGLPPSAPRKFEIITTLNSFHGRTMAGIAATGQEKVKKGFDPLTPGFVHVPYNDLEAARRAVTPHTAAILIEGMQGEGGIFPATPEYLLGLRELCDRNGILLMIDAVQCGMGRTGSFMSYDRILEGNARASTFKPDAVSMAKSLGNGYPIGAAWIAPQWQDLFQPGTHGTTYGGTPLACAVSLAVLETIQRENLLQNVRSLGDYLKTSLQAMAGASKIREVRGEGLILGIELTEEAKPTVSALLAAGLVVIPSGAYCFRLLPPYNITRAEAEEALALIRKVCGP